MWKYLIAIFYVVHILGQCPAHKCSGQGTLKLVEGVCGQKDYNTGIDQGNLFYGSCTVDQQCVKSDLATSLYLCEDLPAPWLPPLQSQSEEKSQIGYECEGKADCVDEAKDCVQVPSKILTKICVGADEGESCQDYDCNPGLYCNSGICKKLKSLEDECFSDQECPLYAACENKVCKQLLERDANAETFKCTTGADKGSQGNLYTSKMMPGNVDLSKLDQQYINWFCASGTCQLSGTVGNCNEVKMVMDNQTTDYKVCSTDSECIGNNDKQTKCQCGDNQNGEAVCFPQLGDKSGKSYLQYLRNWLDIYKAIEQQGGCVRSEAFTVDCLTRGKNRGKVQSSFIKSYISATIEYGYGWKKQNSKSCVQDVVSKYYSGWEYYLSTWSCNGFTCKSKELNGNYADDVCLKAGTNGFEVKECNVRSDYEHLKPWCPSEIKRNTLQDVTCQEAPDYSKSLTSHFPGYSCEDDQDCQAINQGWCNKDTGKCAGLWLDQDCDPNEDIYSCDVGLTCIQQVENDVQYTRCRPFVKTLEFGCFFDYHCEYGNGCNRDYNSEKAGTCAPWFSLKQHDEVAYCDVTSWENWLCDSGQCQPSNSQYSSKGTCIDAIKSKEPNKQCVADSDCKGTSNNQDLGFVMEGICQCGYDQGSEKICGAFLGDAQGQNYHKALKSLLTHKRSKECQIATATIMGDVETDYYKILQDCYKRIDQSGWKDFRIKEYEYRHSVHLLLSNTNDVCQKNVLNSGYYRLFEDEEVVGGAFNLAVGLILYFLI